MTHAICLGAPTQIGLCIKRPIDFAIPTPEMLDQYVRRAERLLEELHECLEQPFLESLKPEHLGDRTYNPFTLGSVLREPIFYGGESAYLFQYRDIAERKYLADNSWLLAHRGFTIQTARAAVSTLGAIQNEKVLAGVRRARASVTTRVCEPVSREKRPHVCGRFTVQSTARTA
jgi:hypothetical protein